MPSKKILLLLFVAGFVVHAAAYDHPLDSSAIRDAYFLGSDAHQFAGFAGKYVKQLPAAKSDPYVSQIEVRTPFAQVAESSHEHSVGYSAQQAEDDYRKNPGIIQVRVQILVAPANGNTTVAQLPAACQGVNRMNSALDCFRDFRFRFTQGKQLQPRNSFGVPIYSVGDSSVFIGGDVWFSFRASEVASAPLHVLVSRPDGQRFSADFDLSALR